jgi:cysteine desulfurase/selenocysteine lyase
MDLTQIKSQFPVFRNNPSLVYADNASTTQHPHQVIDAVANFERQSVANTHRGLYELAERATQQFEEARSKVARFIGATGPDSIAFTKGTTESINSVAFGFLKDQLDPGDEVVISAMEHHANLIPWQQVCKERKAILNVIPVNQKGELEMDSLPELIGRRTKFLALVHISNTLGTINPVEEIIQVAHQHGVPVLIDAAQSIAHYPVNVNELGADFITFSAHKMFGPFGVGVLYAHPKHRERMKPLVFGGGAIKNVTFKETEWLDFPRNLEAGTPNVSGVVGLSAALDFIHTLPMDDITANLNLLRENLEEGINMETGFRIIGEAGRKGSITSFVHEHIHPHDIATFLASRDIAARAGHHCTQPLLESLGLPATVRVSFSVYNNQEDVDQILEALREVKKFWL